MSEIPNEIREMAREVVLQYLAGATGGELSEPAVTLVRSGQYDDWPLYAAAARAILAERQRCVNYMQRRPGIVPLRQEIASALLRGDVCDASGRITQGASA